MIALLQRVSRASVSVAGQCTGSIGRGLLVLLCAERADNELVAARLLKRVLAYRVFEDDSGRMNRSLADLAQLQTATNPDAGNLALHAGLLVVPQFTLAADTRSGLRPSFTPAAPPERGRALFESFVQVASESWPGVQTGQFGADMQVELVNDGPVTFWLQL